MRRSVIGVAMTATFVLGLAAAPGLLPHQPGSIRASSMATSHSPLFCGTYHNRRRGLLQTEKQPNGSRSIVGFNTSNYCGGLAVPKLSAKQPRQQLDSGNESFPAGTVIPLTGAGISIGAPTCRSVRMDNPPRALQGPMDPGINRFKGLRRSARSPAAATPAEVLAHEESPPIESPVGEEPCAASAAT